MEDPMRRVGILGGTFDPVHNGHLLLGEQAHREYGLDEIWFMPSHVPPHKKDHHITDGAARIRIWSLPRNPFRIFRSPILRWDAKEIPTRRRHWRF